MQWYLTWGRPNGDDERCDEIPQVCTYEGMQDAVTETYSTYGCMFNPGQVSPAGEAFREFSFLLCLNKLENVFYNINISRKKGLAKVDIFCLNREVKKLYGEDEFQSLYVPGDHHPTLKVPKNNLI